MALRKVCTRFITRSGLAVLAVLMAASAFTATIALIVPAQPALAADYCSKTNDKTTNIIYCGLDDTNYTKSFQNYYDANSDAHSGNPTAHTDLQTVYKYGGASKSLVDGMDTSNTYVGYSHSDGTIHITYNGTDTVVGTNMQIAARWVASDKQNFTYIPNSDGVYMHSYTRWFSDGPSHGPDVTTLVHINTNTGKADFALWTPCGNMLTFTPQPLPKKLVCVSLTQEADSTLKYTFTAKASAQNETIQSYVFDFGDGNSQTVTTSSTTATSGAHTYTQTDAEQNLTAKVSVNGSSDQGVTSSNCKTTVTIPPKQQQKPTLACVSLKPETTDNKTFTFTATAQTTGQAFTSYTFDFGDGNSQTQSGNVAQHTYANTGTYTASFTASSPDGKTVLTDACKTTVTYPTPHMPPASGGGLVNTGPGDVIGIFTVASLAGGALYQVALRKKLQA